MKITLHIDDKHTPTIIQLLAGFLAKAEPSEPQADPAPGHPELPLPGMPVSASITGLTIAAADPLKVAMDDPVEAEDPTRRELPWGDLPEPPPLPEGKTRWVNRGEFPGIQIYAPDRDIRWLSFGKWKLTIHFSSTAPHIEAI
jgi:hypothetical protein